MTFTLPKIERVSMRLATADDADLEAYDNTRLQAINTCPVWGQLRYGMHKSMSGPGLRQMALEMGSAAHEVFAAVRLWQLRKYQGNIPLSDFHGPRLFGAARYEAMQNAVDDREDDRSQSLAFCLSALETSGFHDDPSDRRRTYTNLEEGCITYIDRWDWNRMPVWIRDGTDPESDVGIELPFDVVLSFTLSGGSRRLASDGQSASDNSEYEVSYRFIGKADGLHVRASKLCLHENKTASRLDEAWRQSFLLSSQITGYCLSLSLWAGQPIESAEIHGMSIPLPKSYDFGGIVRETVERRKHDFERWFNWFLHTVMLDQQFKNNPYDAPRYTHSCNRYFRPCSMIPFCDGDDEEQKRIVEEMYHDHWSPLHEVNASGD